MNDVFSDKIKALALLTFDSSSMCQEHYQRGGHHSIIQILSSHSKYEYSFRHDCCMRQRESEDLLQALESSEPNVLVLYLCGSSRRSSWSGDQSIRCDKN